MQLRRIERLYAYLAKCLFTIEPPTRDYPKITRAIVLLAKMVHVFPASDDGYELWNIGEFTECCLSDFIVGAYWHYSECHTGQNSQGYLALSLLGQIFNPGMSSLDDSPDSAERYAYRRLNNLAGIRQYEFSQPMYSLSK